jgi:hypothetical protein
MLDVIRPDNSVDWFAALLAKRSLSHDEVEAVAKLYSRSAENDFAYFRKLIRPRMLTSSGSWATANSSAPPVKFSWRAAISRMFCWIIRSLS